jgi:hypothetical protein
VLAALRAHFWLKTIGITAFIWLFFMAYFYVQRHPDTSVTIMPLTGLDRAVGVHPFALPIYISLWFYVSLAPGLMTEVRDMLRFGAWSLAWCLLGLGVFYLWPTAVPYTHVDWSQYPGMPFLKQVDGTGNACPSLHVTAAVFTAIWLHRQLRAFGLGTAARVVNVAWCLAIVYSTMATRQHVALDVTAGAALGLVFGWASLAWGGLRRAELARGAQSL